MRKLLILSLMLIGFTSFSQQMSLAELQTYEVRLMPFDVRLRTAPFTVQTISKNRPLTTEMLAQYIQARLSTKMDSVSRKIDSLQNIIAVKASLTNPTFQGNVSGITKAMVGLSNVDNTSDANKPISAATQAVLNQKAPLANPNFYGDIELNSIGNGVIIKSPSGIRFRITISDKGDIIATSL